MSNRYSGKNWSYGIIAAIGLFMMFTMVLVYIMVNQKTEVLYSNYYERSLDYDGVQEQLSRGQLPEYKVNYKQNTTQDSIFFFLPFNETATGSIAFVKPDNSKFDTELKFKLEKAHALAIDVSNFQKGNWHVELVWKSDSVSVMNRLKIIL